MLNNCEVLVRNGHYNTRHDAILHLLLKEAIKYLPPMFNIYVDHKDSSTHFPTHIIATSQSPDIVIWRKDLIKVYFVKLTICHETNFNAANERKQNRYAELVNNMKEKGIICKQINIEVGSRGFINIIGLQQFFYLLNIPTKLQQHLMSNIVKTVIEHSFKIWLVRNRLHSK